MKKSVAILLLFVYLCFNMGMTLNVHYCGGKLASLSLMEGKGCVCGKKEMPQSCCKDTQTNLSVDDTQDRTLAKFQISTLVALAPAPSLQIYLPENVKKLSKEINLTLYVLDTGPPKTPIYIQHRSIIV